MDRTTDDVQQATLLPRFSIRALLWILTICAVVFLIVGMAYRGQYWAWGVTIGLVSLLLTALVHGAWFGVVWLFAQLRSGPAKESE